MTRNKKGHNLLAQDSAKPPIDEATDVTKNGPEVYSESGSSRLSEDDEPKASKRSTGEQSSGSITKSATKSPAVPPRRFAFASPRYGSPFAYLSDQNKYDFFKGLLSDRTCMLFDQIVAEASTLRRLFLKDPVLTNTGYHGHFCTLRACHSLSTASGSSEEGDSDETKVQFYYFGHGSEKDLVRLPLVNTVESNDSTLFGSEEESIAEEKIGFLRDYNPSTGEYEYYMMPHKFDDVAINGFHVDQNRIAGPLPDFAVVEVERQSYFWWRTADALDYVPSLKRKRDCKRDFEDDIEESASKVSRGDTDCSPNSLISPRMSPDPPVADSQVFMESKSWLEEYRHRLQICEERPVKYTNLITNTQPPHEYPSGEMHETDVILAIGAVLLGLKHAEADFAYANSLLFSVARSMRMVGIHTVNRNDHFIIPLLFSPELSALPPEAEEDTVEPLSPVFSAFQRGEEEKNQENYAATERAKQNDPGNKNKPPPSLEDQERQNKYHFGGIGHFMLAIAEKVNRGLPSVVKELGEPKTLVRLRFMDSAVGTVKRGLIRRVARNTVRNSGWLGDTWPSFDADEEYWMDVLEQSGNRCGEHTVLNAWAYMLEIPLAATRDRRLGFQSYQEVRKMIDLALRGQLDSLTIRAWMQHSRYAVEEPFPQRQQDQTENPGLPRPLPTRPLRNMETVALNEYAFNEIIDEMYMQEQVSNQNHASYWSAVEVPAKPDGATTQQSRQAPKVASGIALPPKQAPVTSISRTQSISASPAGPAEKSPTTPTAIPTPKNWRQSLHRGLIVNNAYKVKYPRKTGGTRKNASIIPSFSDIAKDDVILAIAPIWEGLKRLGRPDYHFTYAGMDVLSIKTGQPTVGAVGGWSRFIIPLFLSREGKALENEGQGRGKGQHPGHALLVVAELVDDRPMTVQLQVYDNGVHNDLQQSVEPEAKRIINRSGWLGANQSTASITYRTSMVQMVPHQVGENTSGLHVILNAWAYMLKIPLHSRPLRRGRTETDRFDAKDTKFLRQGLELVNLALSGFMDSATIQAFFQVHGYSVEQRFGDPSRAVIPVYAVGMNREKFYRTLQRRKWTSMLTAARAQEETLFPDATMAELMGQGLSRDQAWTALVVANGNRDGAFQWHFDSDVPGEMPDPRDALSPVTPPERRGGGRGW